MPYRLDPSDRRCVQVQRDDGQWERIDGGCHDTEDAARRQLTALRINVDKATDSVTTGRIEKLDEDRRLVFGWAYVAVDKNGDPVVDHSGDVVVDFEADFEDAAYDYVQHSREGDAMHEGPVVAQLVESFVVTPEKAQMMGVDGAPTGWWVGMKVTDDAVWERVKDGGLRMFSIAGIGEREALNG